ncbi:hypothetical protein LSH36_33g03003 [Paralvinella palmiformis]|uniref:Signal transducer and activator of transcription n=1 Tax=Paralvinella palmiformis TaxID=53620 RepID=A0AAD9K8R7_9ANNE|nr:hypothetical protein LSH36_33g03003 [Paralvinella palmiformis]
MALWEKVQQCLHGDTVRQLQSVYGVHFPIDVRHTFAEWIEAQPWFTLEEDNSEHERIAGKLVEQLVLMIENRANELNSEDMFINKLRLQEIGQQFREMYSPNPFNLVRVVRNCLGAEERQVQQAEMAGGDSEQACTHRQIYQQFDMLQRRTQQTDLELKQLQQKQEAFIIRYQESLKLENILQELGHQPNGPIPLMEREQALLRQKQSLEMEIQTTAKELLQMKLTLAKKYSETCQQLNVLQSHILDEQLISWKRQQQLAGNGAPFEGSLETLQQWCESLAELIWQNRIQIKRIEMLCSRIPINTGAGPDNLLTQLNTTITSLLSSLVTSTFIIEKQPPQVLKKDSKFGATVRLMVGGKLNVHMNPPTVKASIISEEQARSLLRSERDVRKESSGDILNNVGTMEYNQANGQLAVSFRNMTLKKIKRAEKKGNETVTEEKFSILFQSQFTVGGGELDFQVWTLSLPAVVTVHGNQECNALATILWDNAFAESGRIPFQVPDRVPWPQLAQALNTKFASNCGIGLDAQHLSYLASKIFGPHDDYSTHMVSWAHFNREPLHMRNFTFWEYFYSVFKLTKDWLHGPWKERLIHGFVSKKEAQDNLLKKPIGTFLLRFSDSELGGITIAWVDNDPNRPGEKQVWNLAPFTDKDFKIRSLGDRIKDLPHLVNLYPDIPKQDAFGKFWSQQTDTPVVGTGYIRPQLVSVIPGISAPLNYDNPLTPSMMQPQSPPSPVSQPAANIGDSINDINIDNDIDSSWLQNLSGMDYDPSDIQQMGINRVMPSFNAQSMPGNNFPSPN